MFAKKQVFYSLIPILVILVIVLYEYLSMLSFPGGKEYLEQQCQPVIHYLKIAHEKTERYPELLPQQYQKVLDSLPTKGKYEVSKDGQGCLIEFKSGGHIIPGFLTLTWRSYSDRWHLDD